MRENMAECEEWLLAHLDGRHFDALVECNAAAHRKQKSEVAGKERSKFDRLLKPVARGDCVNGITRHKGGGVENPRGRSVTNLLPKGICKRWVTDLTSRKLGRAEMSVLAHGLNFSVYVLFDVVDAVRVKISASLMKKRKCNFNITCEE